MGGEKKKKSGEVGGGGEGEERKNKREKRKHFTIRSRTLSVLRFFCGTQCLLCTHSFMIKLLSVTLTIV